MRAGGPESPLWTPAGKPRNKRPAFSENLYALKAALQRMATHPDCPQQNPGPKGTLQAQAASYLPRRPEAGDDGRDNLISHSPDKNRIHIERCHFSLFEAADSILDFGMRISDLRDSVYFIYG